MLELVNKNEKQKTNQKQKQKQNEQTNTNLKCYEMFSSTITIFLLGKMSASIFLLLRI